jgi:biotin carboxyl carrier protein
MEQVTTPLRLVIFSSLAMLSGTVVSYQVENLNHHSYLSRLEATTSPIYAPFDGVMETIHHREGETVHPTLEVATLSSSGIEKTIEEKKKEIALLTSEKMQVQAKANLELTSRVRALDKELFETRIKSSAYLREKYSAELQTIAWEDYLKSHNAVAMSSLTPEVFRTALEGGMRTDDQSINAILAHGSAVNALEVFSAQVDLCLDRENILVKSMDELPQEINTAFGIDLIDAKITQAKIELNMLEEMAEGRVMTSTVHGRIGNICKRVGDRVQKGETVAEIIDEQRRYLIAQIPLQQVPYIREGQIASLTFPGNKKRKGVFRKIPMSVRDAGPLQFNKDIVEDPVVEIQIDPTVDSVWPMVPVGSTVKLDLKLVH